MIMDGDDSMETDFDGAGGHHAELTMEDFDPFIASERELRARRVTGSEAADARNALLFEPPPKLHPGGRRPESPSEAELDVVQQVMLAEQDEAKAIFQWALDQLPTYGAENTASVRQLLAMPHSRASRALFRAGFLFILANSKTIRSEASSGFVANRIYHRIPEAAMHRFFACEPVDTARRQYVIVTEGTGQSSDTEAARSVLFVNRVRNMVQKGGVEGFSLAHGSSAT